MRLLVTVHNGQLNEEQDSQVIVKVGDNEKKTTTKLNTKKPVWEQSYQFFIFLLTCLFVNAFLVYIILVQ
jgi:hypothetical protein